MSKQLLKEMIERRNDFVRKREFDMLRKMRKREAMAVLVRNRADRPYLPKQYAVQAGRPRTNAEKIDEIEAQMSMQWWKTKSADLNSIRCPHLQKTNRRP
jgi:hypothetical protein